MRLITSTFNARPLGIALAMAGSLAACSTTAATTKAAADNVPAVKQEIAMGCLAGNVEWIIGKKPEDALVAKAQADAEAKTVRVVKAGTAVTMEYNGARLTLLLNIKGVIEKAYCG